MATAMKIDGQMAAELLCELVAIDSVNPTLVPGAPGEAQAAEHVRAFLAQHGIAAKIEEAAPGRPNVVARLGPAGAKPALGILAHTDTVGAGDMQDAFQPRERDGRLYGRGALDIKSGVAAMCAAAIAIVRERLPLRRALLIAGVADEECDSAGTEALLRRETMEAAVVLEPTDLKLVIAHKGYAWFEIVTHGRSAHGSLPAEGRDAIRMMGRVLNLLDALDRKLAALHPHPRLGNASLHASVIQGGQEFSSYPAKCRLLAERRILPGESAGEIEAELRSLLAGLETRDAEFRATLRGVAFRPPYEIEEGAPIVRQASEAIRRAGGTAELGGMAAWTDTALLAAAGIPGVVFGPSGRGLHGADEYVELASIAQCAESLYEMIRTFCC